jgi:hypothetical protein
MLAEVMMVFKNGEQLAGVCFEGDTVIKVGEQCDSIIVSMESGQMAGVPWFEVWKDGKIISKWNAAKCEGVLYT